MNLRLIILALASSARLPSYARKGATLMDAKFSTNLLRMIAAQTVFQNALSASREMFGKSYFSLGLPEKNAVDQAVVGAIQGNMQLITPQFLEGQQAQQPIGFPTQPQPPTTGKSTS
jgi:hypothetical protein